MAWGIEKWAESWWGGEDNRSFELRGPIQGTAERWGVDSLSEEEGIGCFDVEEGAVDGFWGATIWNASPFSLDWAVVSWDPWENFENEWRLPYHVHFVEDTVNVVTAPDATVGDFNSQRTLIGEMLDKHKAHRLLGKPVHLAPDLVNALGFAAPDNLLQAILTTNALRAALWDDSYDGSGHFFAWPAVHRREDVPNRPPTELVWTEGEMVTLINLLKALFNQHLALLSYGDDNSDSHFAFTDSMLQAMAIGDLAFESFERQWAVPDILPYIWTYPPLPGRQENQLDMYDLDAGIALGGGWGFSAPLPRAWGTLTWGAEQTASWPGGHEHFLKDLSDILVEERPEGGETFNKQWFLPGSSTSWPNQRFIADYWDAVEHTWRFRPGRTQLGVTEDFEAGWKDNEEGLAKYWDGSKWRFIETPLPPDRQLLAAGLGSDVIAPYGGIDSWGFAQCIIDNPAGNTYADPLPVHLGYSVDVCVKIVSGAGIGGPAIIQVNFTDGLGLSDSCYVVLDGGEVAGAYLFQAFAESPSFAAPRHHFWEKWGGMAQITSASVISGATGTFAIRGYLGHQETFEEYDWTLTLTI